MYEPPFYEWTIWRKPNTEEKRKLFRSGLDEDLQKLAYCRVFFEVLVSGEREAFDRWCSGGYGESQTLRKSESFFEVAWTRTLQKLAYCRDFFEVLVSGESFLIAAVQE